MAEAKLPREDLCESLMRVICAAMHGAAKRYVDYLRHGPKSRVDEDMGRHILALAPAQLTLEQLDALETALCQIQEELLGWLFSIVDGATQPAGFPDKMRLVNMDTGEVICPEGLEWAFGGALAAWRSQSKGNDSGKPEGS